MGEPQPCLPSWWRSSVPAPGPSDKNSEALPIPEPMLSALSNEQEPPSCTGFISLEERQKLTFRDSTGEFSHPLPVVNVMMVERTGEKTVRWINIGWMYLTSWVRAESKFRTHSRVVVDSSLPPHRGTHRPPHFRHAHYSLVI